VDIFTVLVVLVDVIYNILWISLFARIILSWFPHKKTFISEFLKDVTDPILNPVKKIIPVVGGLDLSPILAFFLLRIGYILVLNLLVILKSSL
jgi:YggT family protein